MGGTQSLVCSGAILLMCEERVHQPMSGTLSYELWGTVSQARWLRPSGNEILCQAARHHFLFPECSLTLPRQGQGLCPPWNLVGKLWGESPSRFPEQPHPPCLCLGSGALLSFDQTGFLRTGRGPG